MSEKQLPPEFSHTKKDNGEQSPRVVTRRDFVKIASAVAGAAAVGSGIALPGVASAAGKKAKYDPVSIGCFGSTGTTITLNICGGATTGAPAGFSVQWMTLDAFNSYAGAKDGTGWPVDDTAFCKASFSGQANGTIFSLGPSACQTVVIAGLNDSDPGVSFTCNDPLLCETTYIFRAFAHATNLFNRSDYSTQQCSTTACEELCGTPVENGDFCTQGQAYFHNANTLPALMDCLGGDGGSGTGATATPIFQNACALSTPNCTTNCSGTLVTLGDVSGFTYIWSLNGSYTDIGTGNKTHCDHNFQFVDSGLLALQDALNGGGQSSFFTADGTNASDTGHGGGLAKEAIALTLNLHACLGDTAYGDVLLCNFVEGSTFTNGGTAISAASAALLNGQTISDVLAKVNEYLGAGGTVDVPYALAINPENNEAAVLTELLGALNVAFANAMANSPCDSGLGGATAFALAHLMHGSCVACED